MTTIKTSCGTVTKREDGKVALIRCDNRAGVFLHVELSEEEVAAIKDDDDV